MNEEIKKDLSIGEVAKRSGISISAIHFYERKGLIEASRNESDHRRYHRSVLRKLAIIKAAQYLGFSLEEIQGSLKSLQNKTAPGDTEWKKISKTWSDELSDRIEKLKLMRDQLSSCIGCGCLSLKECPLRNPQDMASKFGPGSKIIG